MLWQRSTAASHYRRELGGVWVGTMLGQRKLHCLLGNSSAQEVALQSPNKRDFTGSTPCHTHQICFSFHFLLQNNVTCASMHVYVCVRVCVCECARVMVLRWQMIYMYQLCVVLVFLQATPQARSL